MPHQAPDSPVNCSIRGMLGWRIWLERAWCSSSADLVLHVVGERLEQPYAQLTRVFANVVLELLCIQSTGVSAQTARQCSTCSFHLAKRTAPLTSAMDWGAGAPSMWARAAPAGTRRPSRPTARHTE